MQIYAKGTETTFVKEGQEIVNEWRWVDYSDFEKKYINDRENNAKFWAFSNYLEGIGVLMKRNLIDPNLVDDLMSSLVIRFWEKMGPLSEEWRTHDNFPQLNEHIEMLYLEVKRIAMKQHKTVHA